jgi:predicted MFS family arabinose efflux permease
MPALAFFIALVILAHASFVGSRMSTTLFAIELGASPFTVGVLLALFAALPMLLSVSAGRLVDRTGPRRPMLLALVAQTAGVALPFAWPALPALYVATTLIGTAFLYLHVAVNSVVGAVGRPEERATNFSWLALGFSTSGSLGPLLTGFAIDGIGHARAFGLLALLPALAFGLLWAWRAPVPQHAGRAETGERRVLDLLRIPGLRHAFIVSGVLAMGWDLYTFLIPLYGSRIRLSASTIGVIMATFAAATFAVRLAMPALARRLREWQVITAALAITGAGYMAFPFVTSVAMLMTLSFVLGIGLGCAQPMIMAILYNSSPQGRQGEVVGVRTFMLNASHTVIPIASGAMSAALGMTPVFLLLAAVMLAGGWFARQKI